jgi:hypothetical protein
MICTHTDWAIQPYVLCAFQSTQLQPASHLPVFVAPADCDSCVMTLLNDLATMGEELHLVKSQLQGLSASVGALEQIRLMETQAKDLRVSLWGIHARRSVNKVMPAYPHGTGSGTSEG